MAEITRASIESAWRRIEPHVRQTPVLELDDFDPSFRVVLKLEHLQVTGSFKPRGAFSLLTAERIPTTGVVAASGGNFAQAVAYACRQLGVPATIFVPSTSPAEKINRTREHGADVRVIDGYYDDALDASLIWAEESGALMAHAYDQPAVVAGQGTLGRELEQQMADADAVLVPVGGGGLIAGIASWFRGERQVIAVEPELCPGFHAARAAGKPVATEVGGIAVSSLGARSIGDLAWEAEQWIDDSILVTEDAVADAQRWLWENARLLVEPAGATALAALRSHAYAPEPGGRVVVVLSGANTDPATIG